MTSPVQSNPLFMNFLSVKFDAEQVTGEILPYNSNKELREQQDTYKRTWFLRRAGKRVQAVPLIQDAASLGGEKTTFSTVLDWQLFERLLEEGIRNLLCSLNPHGFVTSYGPVILKAIGTDKEIVGEVFKQRPDMLKKLSWLQVYRRYHFEAVHLRMTQSDAPRFGLRVKLTTSWNIGVSVAELVRRGIDVRDCYVVPFPRRDGGIGKQSAGAIRQVQAGLITLYDTRDSEIVNANSYTVEASQQNVARFIERTTGDQSRSAYTSLRSHVGEFLGAPEQQNRIARISKLLANQAIPCASGVMATVDPQLIQTNSQTTPLHFQLEPPKYLLKYGGPPITETIATALENQGPFDRDSFKKTNPYVLVITPKHWTGQVEQFLAKWRDGKFKSPYAKGFKDKYCLRGCEIRVVDFDLNAKTIGEDYQTACVSALQESKERIRRFDLAIVVTTEKHRQLGGNDPYLIAKATLMGAGVPVQAIEIETINTPVESWPFILNNLGLASYAKLGGTPWVLASPKGQGITHEVIVGLGSAVIQHSRLQGKEKYVGIATVFNYDGVYLVSKTSQEATIDDYSEKLETALLNTLTYVSARKGWQARDRVRLIFHTFKPLKNTEIEAVKRLVRNHLARYEVDFAFLEIGNEHNSMLYDPSSSGHKTYKGAVRGVQVPWRGNAVLLNEQELLLTLTGPREIKFTDHGAPAPVRLYLNGGSTFRDLRYLAQQVFDFSYMSWQTFNLLSEPVTISYSDMIARLLGRLRQVKNWNANVLDTEFGDSLWFL